MEKKEYLSEEEYQRVNKKIRKIGLILLIVGMILVIGSICFQIFGSTSIKTGYICGILAAPSIPMIGIGTFLLITSYQRQINAYMAQQQMPIRKESIEKISPSIGVAAKEITKGVKEGLKDSEE